MNDTFMYHLSTMINRVVRTKSNPFLRGSATLKIVGRNIYILNCPSVQPWSLNILSTKVYKGKKGDMTSALKELIASQRDILLDNFTSI